jgi:casein kinase II subunit alpha
MKIMNCGVGTIHYKAPELFLGYKYYDYAADMWSFGVILAG